MSQFDERNVQLNSMDGIEGVSEEARMLMSHGVIICVLGSRGIPNI